MSIGISLWRIHVSALDRLGAETKWNPYCGHWFQKSGFYRIDFKSLCEHFKRQLLVKGIIFNIDIFVNSHRVDDVSSIIYEQWSINKSLGPRLWNQAWMLFFHREWILTWFNLERTAMNLKLIEIMQFLLRSIRIYFDTSCSIWNFLFAWKCMKINAVNWLRNFILNRE